MSPPTSDLDVAQMEEIFSAVSLALEKLINQYRTLHSKVTQHLEDFDDEISDFCQELESMRHIIADDSETLSIRVGCVGDLIEFIKSSFEDVSSYLVKMESALGIKRASIIDDKEWHALKQPDLAFFQDKKNVLDTIMSRDTQLADPIFPIFQSWKNIILTPNLAPTIAVVISYVIYIGLNIYAFNFFTSALSNLYYVLSIYVICVVAFLSWISAANDNLRQEKVTGLTFTPGWCVASFFVPIAFFYWPYQAITEIWKASSSNDENWQSLSTPLIIPVWWFLLLLPKLSSIVYATFDLSNYVTFDHYFFGFTMLNCLSAILGIIMVCTITARQVKKFKIMSSNGAKT
jgi:hypothetical protein